MVRHRAADLRERPLCVRARRQSQLEEFEDIIGRNFKQPAEGLGWDNTPASHMWRTIMMPTRAL